MMMQPKQLEKAVNAVLADEKMAELVLAQIAYREQKEADEARSKSGLWPKPPEQEAPQTGSSEYVESPAKAAVQEQKAENTEKAPRPVLARDYEFKVRSVTGGRCFGKRLRAEMEREMSQAHKAKKAEVTVSELGVLLNFKNEEGAVISSLSMSHIGLVRLMGGMVNAFEGYETDILAKQFSDWLSGRHDD